LTIRSPIASFVRRNSSRGTERIMNELDKRRRKKLQSKVDKGYRYRDYSDSDVEVRTTKCGKGVFAARQFLPGELVMEITGQYHRRRKYEGSDYVMEVDDQWVIEPNIPAAYLNHSCNPNCELIHVTKFTLGLLALCNIEPGTEFTFDYQWEALDWIPRCQCGAPNCRGWVVSRDAVKKMEKLAKKTDRKKPR
jgi:hypothetical protein